VEIAEREKIKPPSIIVVGEVVSLRDRLGWFEKIPLFGKKIIVTRARAQASDFVERLQESGANTLEFPTIDTVEPESWADLDAAIDNASKYDWIIFTSVNGLGFLLYRMKQTRRDIRELAGPKLCAIGSKTAAALESVGMRVDLVPDEFRAEAIIKAIGDVKGKKILIPRALEAREVLPVELKKMGAEVDVVTAYRTVIPEGKKNDILKMVRENEIDMVTFTSSSTVTNFAGMFEKSELEEIQGKIKVASIGPITSETAKKLGFKIDVSPSEYTIDALTQSIVGYYNNGKGQ
jgi:uroporphyrinogen III methyltransferase/synthase